MSLKQSSLLTIWKKNDGKNSNTSQGALQSKNFNLFTTNKKSTQTRKLLQKSILLNSNKQRNFSKNDSCLVRSSKSNGKRKKCTLNSEISTKNNFNCSTKCAKRVKCEERTNSHLNFIALYKKCGLENIPLPTKKDIQQVNELTTGQSNNQNWSNARKGRITASIFHDVLVKMKKVEANKTVSLNPIIDKVLGCDKDLSGIPAIEYGRAMEPKAKLHYEMIMKNKGHRDLEVKECGLFLHPMHSYIGASPDLLVSCSCCGLGLVEIKCPWSISHTSPALLPPKFMTSKPDEPVKLNTRHKYYTQVQGQMGVLNLKWCDFLVFTEHGSLLERIDFDGSFWDLLLEKLKLFFTSKVAAHLSC